MTGRHLRSILAAITCGSVWMLGLPLDAAATIGPYTYPFYGPHTMTQDYGPTHTGIDWSMSIGTDIVATRGGTIGGLKEDLYDGAGPDQFGQGNYVFLSHGSSRWSLYYHLTHNGVAVTTGSATSAGQRIADSGDTGQSSGPHLHYSLKTTSDCQQTSCTTDPRLWTTNPGRVPFLATYDSESNAGTEFVCQYETITHWVKFKNTGGASWSTTNDANGRGRIILYSTTSSGTTLYSSPLVASDWGSATLVTVADQAPVAPDAKGTFTFEIRGNGTPGTTSTNYFNLMASTLHWFSYSVIGGFYAPVYIMPHGVEC